MSKLHKAAERGALHEVGALLQQGANIDALDKKMGFSPFHYACYFGQKEAAEFLMRKGADIRLATRNGYNSILVAAWRGHTPIVKMLLEEGIPAGTAVCGYSVLHAAASAGQNDMVQLLISKGVDVNTRDRDGVHRTPLRWAVQENHLSVIQTLLDNGAEIDAQDEDGDTPLIQASGEGWLEVVRLLLERGADVNFQNHGGSTALILAAAYDNADIVSLLLQHGADRNLKEEDGKTALDFACEYGHEKSAQILRDFPR